MYVVARRLPIEAKPNSPSHFAYKFHLYHQINSIFKNNSLSSSDHKLFIEMLKWCVVVGIVAAFAVMGCVRSSRFDELFQPDWALDHFTYEGELVKMKLDSYSGAGFSSKRKYMYGKVTVQIKLVEGDSAGTVTALYMSSDGPYHNEFDFEFLGNTTGDPYLVQTNVYVNGVGNREQRLNLWFDPTKDFHSYSILWNQRQVV
ncbi:hypothetical protein C2S51_036964 [Perilla frutescens var. frutescens]|nr:hypothetical protein C2S51_036964 [Perilla frutescens var. frutescens]